MSIKPNKLVSGDRVGITAPARKISYKEISYAIKLFNSWGLEVVIGESIDSEDNQFSGSDEFRARDFQRFLDDKTINAIFCARGGYGSVRIIDKLDFSSFKTNPKWIIGYSDPSLILNHIYFNYNIESIHGIMPVNIGKDSENSAAISSLRDILFEDKRYGEYKTHKLNSFGEVEGELIGGNLSVLYSLMGSNSFQSTEGKILFLEDLDEYIYHIDRMMNCLKRGGKLSSLKALVIGGFTDMQNNTIPFGQSPYEIIYNSVQEYDYPVVFDIPIGHIGDNNQAIIIGRNTKLISNNERVIISQE